MSGMQPIRYVFNRIPMESTDYKFKITPAGSLYEILVDDKWELINPRQTSRDKVCYDRDDKNIYVSDVVGFRDGTRFALGLVVKVYGISDPVLFLAPDRLISLALFQKDARINLVSSTLHSLRRGDDDAFIELVNAFNSYIAAYTDAAHLTLSVSGSYKELHGCGYAISGFIGAPVAPDEQENIETKTGMLGRATSMMGYIEAAIHALTSVKTLDNTIDTVYLYTPSAYFNDLINKRMPFAWAKKGWRTGTGTLVENHTQWERFNIAAQGLKIEALTLDKNKLLKCQRLAEEAARKQATMAVRFYG